MNDRTNENERNDEEANDFEVHQIVDRPHQHDASTS